MKITPVATPGGPAQNVTMTTTNVNNEARNKAISMLTTNSSSPQEAAAKLAQQQQAVAQVSQQQMTPVANQNQVAPEEMRAIKAQTLDTSTQSEVAETAETEEATTEAQAAPAKNPALTKQFAELARQERILRSKAQKQQQELSAQRAAIEVEKAALAEKAKLYEQGYISRDRLKSDPLGVLAENELSYDEITQQILNQPQRDPRTEAHIQRLEAQNKKLEAAIEQIRTEGQQQQDTNYKQAVKQITTDVKRLIKADPTTYEAITKTDAIQDVVDLIVRTHKEEGYVMTGEEAAKEVENYLTDSLYDTYNRIDKLKKRIAQANPTSAVAKPVQQKIDATEQTQTGAKTLTNNMTAAPKLSGRERAILAAQGKLNKG